MAMTPRQIRTEHILLIRRNIHRNAEELAIAALAQGDREQIKKQIADWSRL
jgi:hypothetical protein